MPDHVHLLLAVKEQLPQGKHLGSIVRGFKTGCTRAWWKLQDEAVMADGVSLYGRESVQGKAEGGASELDATLPASVDT